jgi:hypothetical protein
LLLLLLLLLLLFPSQSVFSNQLLFTGNVDTGRLLATLIGKFPTHHLGFFEIPPNPKNL